MHILHENWSTMVDSLFFANPIVAVDTNRSVIAIVSSIVINVTAGFKDENNPVNSNVAYVVHLDDNKKAIKFDIAWDNNDPALQAAFSKVIKRLDATSKVSQGAMPSLSAEKMITGQ